jgi:hypothetical protein
MARLLSSQYTTQSICGLSLDPIQILSRINEELEYEFQKTLKTTAADSATEPGASTSTDNEKDTNKINLHDCNKEETTQNTSGSKQSVEKKTSGGIFSCFRGSKVTDVSGDDVYEKATDNDGKNNNS